MPLSFTEVVDHPLFSLPHRWRMGVRGLAPEAWLQPDDARAADLALKAAMMAEAHTDAVRWEPGSEAAAREVVELVAGALEPHGWALAADGAHPIEIAGRSIQEDLCLMERQDRAWRLTAGCVCFPTRWSLADKIGGSLAAIHAPVPAYAEQLAARVERFFDRMAIGSIVHRINWSLVADPARRLPARSLQAPAVLPDDPATQLFVRVERQTLRRLAAHPAIVFGIRIHVWSLGEVVDQLPGAAFAAELRRAPAAVARYKNLDGLRAALADWLERGGEGA